MTNLIRSLWQFRSFIVGMVYRDFMGKHLGSILGSLWAIITPLALILIYTVIFSQVMKTRLPEVTSTMGYGFFICIGVICWSFFSETVLKGQTVFLEHSNLIKKSKFPHASLLLIVLFSTFVNFLIIFSLFMIVLIVTGNFPGWVILTIFPLLLLQQAFALGLGFLLGILNVFFRDIGPLTGIVLQFWFWLTPVVYPISILPEPIKELILRLNPLAPLVASYQKIILFSEYPVWSDFSFQIVLAFFTPVVCFFFYKHFSGEIVDEL
ncbi:MAG: ABC transporter permease [Nitrospinae bacterium]|nr:ABC transporter permease [Nitrospinota bacterium]